MVIRAVTEERTERTGRTDRTSLTDLVVMGVGCMISGILIGAGLVMLAATVR